jgi:hypothetical protein
VVDPSQILIQRSSAGSFIGWGAASDSQEIKGTNGVVKLHSHNVDGASDGRFIDGQGGFQKVVFSEVENQIAEIVMTICPSGTVLVKDSVHCVCGIVDSHVVQPDIAMDQDVVGRVHTHPLVHLADLFSVAQQFPIPDHVGKAVANPVA